MLEAVDALQVGPEREQRVEEVGHPEPAVAPALAGRRARGRDRPRRTGSAAARVPIAADDLVDQSHAADEQLEQLGVDRAVLALTGPQRRDRFLQSDAHAGSSASNGRRSCTLRWPSMRPTGDPGDRVGPQLGVLVVADRVVAEQVGVGEHRQRGPCPTGGSPPAAVLPGRRYSDVLASTRRPDGIEDARAVEARLGDTGQQVLVASTGCGTRSASTQVTTPLWLCRVLNGRVHRPDAEPLEQIDEVVAVLVLVALGEHDQPTAFTHERLESVDLVGSQQSASRATWCAPSAGPTGAAARARRNRPAPRR